MRLSAISIRSAFKASLNRASGPLNRQRPLRRGPSQPGARRHHPRKPERHTTAITVFLGAVRSGEVAGCLGSAFARGVASGSRASARSILDDRILRPFRLRRGSLSKVSEFVKRSRSQDNEVAKLERSHALRGAWSSLPRPRTCRPHVRRAPSGALERNCGEWNC
jgi:hypothetical protein